MKIRSRKQPKPIRLALCITLTISGCADDRLRELGYTQRAEEPPPILVHPEVPQPCDFGVVSLDAVNRAILADISSAATQDRPFLRYLSLANGNNAGDCQIARARARGGVGKLLNSLSRRSEIALPSVVNADQDLLRIDIRDYGWDRPVKVRGEGFADGWEALISSSPYAVELEGPAASFIKSEALSPVPLLGADALIGAASSAEMYYALIDMPDTLGALRESLGLPSALDPFEAGALRSATPRSRVLRATGSLRVVDRYATDSGSLGSYYEALQVDTQSFLADPLHVQPNVQRLISFTLPNDLLAFAVMNASGERAAVAELVLDTSRDDFTATVLSSCMSCHAVSPIPLEDAGRSLVLNNPGNFPDEVVTAYQVSPTEEQRAEIYIDDYEAHQRAVERAGHPAEGQDQISLRALAFNADVDLEAAASDLLVEPAFLRAHIRELHPAFGVLAVGLPLSREEFGQVYASALCTLSARSENRPVAGECEAAQ